MNLHYLIICGSMSAARGLEVIFVGVELGNFVTTNFFFLQSAAACRPTCFCACTCVRVRARAEIT